MKLTDKYINSVLKEAIDKEFAKSIVKGLDEPSPKKPEETIEFGDDPKCVDPGNGRPYNRPVKINGRVSYISRSSVVSMKCFCKNKKGEWCILANQRGNGTTNSGAWNTPVGYLDYDETLEEAAARETYEETGVMVPVRKIQFLGMDSHPGGRKQDVVIRFKAVLDGTTDDYPTTDENSEEGEVADIQWIPLSRVKDKQYRWNGDAQLYHAKMALGDYDKKSGQYGFGSNKSHNSFNGLSKPNMGDPKVAIWANALAKEIKGNQRAEILLKKILGR